MTQNNDESIVVELLPVAKIFPDPVFNCRGEIAPLDVIDLAKSIDKDGLQQPIKVRPRRNNDPLGYDYVVVSGHRRHKAYQVLKREFIPCIIHENLDEFRARTLNAVENLKREDLNLLQEARTISHFIDAGWTRQEIAEEVGMSPGWVQIRAQLLSMPEEIQVAAAVGHITQNHVRDLYAYRKNPKQQLEIARKIKEKRERQDVKTEIVVKRNKASSKKIRKRSEIFEMIELIIDTSGACFATRALAWAAGEITDYEVHESFKQHCDSLNIKYEIPDFELE